MILKWDFILKYGSLITVEKESFKEIEDVIVL